MDGRARGGLMITLACLGLGYCARHYVAEFGARFDRIVGTTRSAERAAVLAQQHMGGRSSEMLVFDGRSASPELIAAVSDARALLVSAAPAEGRDPVLAVLEDEIARAPQLQSVVFLSTLGVYGDSGGAWIDETAETIPTVARRGSARVDAELAWRALGARRKLPVAILRLGGIYGPGQNGMIRLLRGIDPPPEIPYAEAGKLVSPFALSFYDGCIRARNDKLKTVLGVTLRYPTYREGLRALYEAGDHLAVAKPAASA